MFMHLQKMSQKCHTHFRLLFFVCRGWAEKKVEILRTSLFHHEILDKMLGFLHITDPVLSAGSDNLKIKSPGIIFKDIQGGSQGLREQGAGNSKILRTCLYLLN